MEVFVGGFTDIIIEKFKSGSPYNDVSTSPAKLSLESQTKIFHR